MDLPILLVLFVYVVLPDPTRPVRALGWTSSSRSSVILSGQKKTEVNIDFFHSTRSTTVPISVQPGGEHIRPARQCCTLHKPNPTSVGSMRSFLNTSEVRDSNAAPQTSMVRLFFLGEWQRAPVMLMSWTARLRCRGENPADLRSPAPHKHLRGKDGGPPWPRKTTGTAGGQAGGARAGRRARAAEFERSQRSGQTVKLR